MISYFDHLLTGVERTPVPKSPQKKDAPFIPISQEKGLLARGRINGFLVQSWPSFCLHSGEIDAHELSKYTIPSIAPWLITMI
jgi:hypothetical protein